MNSIDKGGLAITGIFAIPLTIAVGLGIYKETNIEKNFRLSERGQNAKMEVKEKDYNRYLRGLEACDEIQQTAKNPNNSCTAYWLKEVKAMQDSLFLDSIAKANYAKGQQMVRDSLKNLK